MQRLKSGTRKIERSKFNILEGISKHSFQEEWNEKMGIQLALAVSFIFMGAISCVAYLVSKRFSHKLVKYIPAITAVTGIVFFYIKLHFISQGYDGIYDMVAIILLSIILGITLVGAVIIELIQWKNSRDH